MSRTLPILFNTEMVKAILDGRKKATRRIAKGVYPYSEYGDFTTKIKGEFTGPVSAENIIKLKAPCYPGDILYVRETWNFVYDMDDSDQTIGNTGRYIYYADDPMPFTHWVDSDTGEHKEQMPWKPSIHMPKEAARIWLKVTDVRVERLQDISGMDVLKEGVNSHVHPEADYFDMNQREMFQSLWNSTIDKKQIDTYGWEANPWVWVIEFRQCEKQEAAEWK